MSEVKTNDYNDSYNFRVSRVMTRLNIIIIDGSSTKTIAFSSNTQWIYLERCVPKVSKYNLKTKCDKSFIEAFE